MKVQVRSNVQCKDYEANGQSRLNDGGHNKRLTQRSNEENGVNLLKAIVRILVYLLWKNGVFGTFLTEGWHHLMGFNRIVLVPIVVRVERTRERVEVGYNCIMLGEDHGDFDQCGNGGHRTAQFQDIRLRPIRFAGLELRCDREYDIKQSPI